MDLQVVIPCILAVGLLVVMATIGLVWWCCQRRRANKSCIPKFTENCCAENVFLPRRRTHREQTGADGDKTVGGCDGVYNRECCAECSEWRQQNVFLVDQSPFHSKTGFDNDGRETENHNFKQQVTVHDSTRTNLKSILKKTGNPTEYNTVQRTNVCTCVKCPCSCRVKEIK